MIKKDTVIRMEQVADYNIVEKITREAFWNVYRPGCVEHYLIHCLRKEQDFVPELDLVMLKNNEIIGHIAYVKASLHTDTGEDIPIMTFGPISIKPELKRQGYGKYLLDYSMDLAKNMGVNVLCIEGNIEFYGKSGFVIASTKNIHYYAEPRENIVPYFLLKELTPGFLNNISGVYQTPKCYMIDEKKVAEFDKKFPHKEKLILPGQLA